MKQTLTLWAIIALLGVFTPTLSAQNTLTPLQKEWVTKIMHLVKASKKSYSQNNKTAACAVSNEITIRIAPCSDVLKRETAVLPKPVQ